MTPCDTGDACKRGRDCASGFCTNGKCDPPSCTDGVKNGKESDKDLDLAVCGSSDTNVSVLVGKGDGTFGPNPTFPASAASPTIVTADFNRDGKPDLVSGNYLLLDTSK